MGKINDKDWEKVLDTHALFQTINESVIKNYKNITPLEILNQIFEPHGVVSDGITTIYPDTKSDNEYFMRMERFDGKTVYHVDLPSMPKGEGGFLKYALTLSEPQLLPDISSMITEKDLNIAPWLSKMRTALIVPTISIMGNSATSILYAYEEDVFSFEDLWRNVVLTYAMTNIMLNVLLRRKADNVCHELDEELKTIGSIQRQLLPAELPDVEGYEWAVHYSTSARAGGDYYDFFLLPENKIGIIIADVSGHGSPAAVVMAMTRLLLHTYPGETAPPLEVFRNINNHLVGNILPGQFITGFYGIIDDTNKTFTYSNAGHCPPQLFRVKSCSMEKLQTSSGMPLGIMNDGRFEQKSIGLNPEDALVFYTDGLSEAMNDSKEMYGERRLQEVLKSAFMKTAEEIKEAIIEDFNNFLITLL